MTRVPISNVRVLLIGNDGFLLWTRELVLKQAGYAVSSALTANIAEHNVETDIVVLCSSIATEAAEALARTVKTGHPSIQIVRLSPSTSIHDGYFDIVCDPTRGPVNLLAELARVRDVLQSIRGQGMQCPCGRYPTEY